MADETKATPPSIKLWNEHLVLKWIRQKRRASRAEIAKELELSSPTASNIVDSLLKKGLLRELGYVDAGKTGGRRPMLLEFNARAGYVVGVDLSGSKIAVCLADLDGAVLARKTQKLREASNEAESIATQISVITRELGMNTGVDPALIKCVSVGIPGITDISSGKVINAPNLGWYNLSFREILRTKLDLPVYMDNDVNMAAIGESRFGAGTGKKNLLFVVIGTGIGAGVIVNGSLYRGYHFSSGEIGYMVLERNFLGEDFDQHGFLESRAAGPAFVRGLEKEWRFGSDPDPVRDVPEKKGPVTVEYVMAEAGRGDPAAVRVVEEITDYICMGVLNAVTVLDPEMIVLGGGVVRAGGLLVERVRGVIERTLPFAPEIRISALGDDAPLLGCVVAGLEELEPYLLIDSPEAARINVKLT